MMNQSSREMDESTNLSFVLKRLFSERNFLFVRILLVLSLLSGFTSIFYRSYIFSCQLSVIQNIILPFVDTKLILYALRFPRDKSLSILGLKLGIFIGGISSFITLLIDSFHYYFGGGRQLAFSLKYQTVPAVTLGILSAELGSQIFLWLFLIMLGAISGLLATIRLRKRT